MNTQQLPLFSVPDRQEHPAFLTTQLITYLGNKRALLPFIGAAFCTIQQRIGQSQLSIVDMFSGTGIVARYCKQFASHLYVNDLEAYSAITNRCYLSNTSAVNHTQLNKLFHELHATIHANFSPGLITELYSPHDENDIKTNDRVFYTRRNAIYLDTARRCIAQLPESEQCYFLAPLLAQASVHANTSGIFKGFYKNKQGIGQYGGTGKDALTRILGDIEIQLPYFSNFECDYTVYQEDANQLVDTMPAVDVAYFDPPYNQHPYGSNYFMLNLLVDYQRPVAMSKVSGIPTNWNRSQYNQRAAAESALFELIAKCPARFVLISYNSEGFIKHDVFLKQLAALGKYTVCEVQYNTFRGSRNLCHRALHVKEYLYLLEKHSRYS
ncbi:DNA adenine methylase [Chromatium okenii]|jgi:adenine-specific DNA-methyltransferase|uniref:site-specific DNA-methyltransferase (adenine-specific) n=1 Tax=Chromatium okenii TaxID=61644 RepID=A0A2S7XQ19_9GAMM|nr:DNA adenine methylase [Chromatium okenii]MBV5308532.1 DNA adenine methylase [Chromatium okenii]PQJ95766.1 DNA modification methylase [Chromatium okenii]